MYEKKFKGNDLVWELRHRQGKRNESERRALREEIANYLPSAPRVNEFREEIIVRIDERDDKEPFRAKYLRESTHFPGIVPELVNDKGEYMLITWATYGSLLLILRAVREGEAVKRFDLYKI